MRNDVTEKFQTKGILSVTLYVQGHGVCDTFEGAVVSDNYCIKIFKLLQKAIRRHERWEKILNSCVRVLPALAHGSGHNRGPWRGTCLQGCNVRFAIGNSPPIGDRGGMEYWVSSCWPGCRQVDHLKLCACKIVRKNRSCASRVGFLYASKVWIVSG